MLNENCKLIQSTLIRDLSYNLKGLLDSMIIKVFIVMQNVVCPQMCQNHKTFIWHVDETEVVTVPFEK